MFLPLHDNNPTTRFPFVTIGIIVANVVALIWLLQLNDTQQQNVVIHYGFIPERVAQLSDPRLVVQVPVSQVVRVPVVNQHIVVPNVVRLPADPKQIYLSTITTMFLHGGWLHLLGNMWFLWLFGNNVEDRLGHLLFLCFYLLSGLLATACHWWYDPQSVAPVIGASGAISAILGAYAITWPHAKVKTLVVIAVIDVPALLFLGLWFVSQLIEAAGLLRLPMQGGARVAEPASVAWWAHVGGFVAGMLLMPLLSAALPLRAPTGTKKPKNFSGNLMARRALPKIDSALDLSRHLVTFEQLPRPFTSLALFDREAPLEVEIGSGKGLFLSAAAGGTTAHNFLGIEVAAKYARYTASRLAKRELPNARLVHGDARRLFVELIPENSLAAVHVYFPDPWWKARHKKRRVMNDSMVKLIERALIPGGTLHFWTDVEEYFQTTLELLAVHTHLTGPHAVQEKPADHDLDYRTHFERRKRQNGLPIYRAEFHKPLAA